MKLTMMQWIYEFHKKAGNNNRQQGWKPRPAPPRRKTGRPAPPAPQIVVIPPPRHEKIDKIRGAQRGKVDYTVDLVNEDVMPFNFSLRKNNLI